MSAERRTTRERWMHRLYVAAIVLKGIDGAVETLSGAVFLFVTGPALRDWIFRVTAPELTEDPDDLIANLLRHSFSHMADSTKIIAGAYLAGHGVVKAMLVAALLRRRRWALFCGAALLIGAIGWEGVRCGQTRSPWMLGAMGFDLAILALIWREYRHGEFGP